MESGISRQTTGLLFITSLCLHGLVLCVLLLSYHVHHILLTRELKQAVPKSVGPNKYAPVIFRPLQTANAQPSYRQQPSTTLLAQANATQTTMTVREMAQTPHKDEPTSDQQKTTHKEYTTTPDTRTSIVPSKTMVELPLEQRPDSMPISYNSDSQLPSSQPTPSTVTPERQNQKTTVPWYKAAATSMQQPSPKSTKQVTLQDITRGFFKSVQQERQAVAGQATQLSTHDMVSRSYETKVHKILQKSVLIESKPITMISAISTPAEIVLTIHKTGKIMNFEFNHQLPRQALKSVEDLLRKAAYSTGLYPSFPRIFTQDVYRFSLPVQIEVTKGSHVYTLNTYYRAL